VKIGTMLRFITKKPDILDNSLYLYMVFTTTIPVEPTIREHIKTSGGGGGIQRGSQR